MNLYFRTVRWKNFIATGGHFTEVRLDQQHMTLIIGKNGSGKSQLLDAICFSLFNKPFRKVNKPSVVNSVNGKDCVVEIEFDTNGHSYKVVRGLKPAKFEIWEDGKLLDQMASTVDYQEFLEKNILKTGYKAFTQIVILGSAQYTPFMRLNANSRREVLDDLLDIQVFSTMNVLAKKKLSDIKVEMESVSKQIESQTGKIEYIRQQISELKKNSDEYKQRLIDEIEGYNESKLNIISSWETIQTQLEELKNKEVGDEDSFVKELRELSNGQSIVKTKTNDLVSHNKFLSDNDHCNMCTQPIDSNFREKKIAENTNEINELQGVFSKISEKIEKTAEKYDLLRVTKGEIKDLKNRVKILKEKMELIQSSLDKTNKELESIDGSGISSILNQNMEALEKEEQILREIIQAKQDLSDEKDLLDIGIKILKDGGVKTQIVKKYLPMINKALNKYLNSMDFMVDFRLDENFEETIMSRFRDEFSYANFSEGEKARIDLSMMLTFRFIAKKRSSVDTNLLILDEVFDSSLDNAGSDELISIFKNIIKNANIFVISHREGMQHHFDKVVTVKKEQNYSVYYQ